MTMMMMMMVMVMVMVMVMMIDDDGEAKPETHRAPDAVDHVKHRHLGDGSPHAGNRVKVEHQIPEGKVLLFETGGKPL